MDDAKIMALFAEKADLLAACEAALLFHSGGPWDEEKSAEWLRLTGTPDASTRNLCDCIRAAVAKAKG